jgi:hypothetical protein
MIYIIFAFIYSGLLFYNVKIISNEAIDWILFNTDIVNLNTSHLDSNKKSRSNRFFYNNYYQNDPELFVPLILSG